MFENVRGADNLDTHRACLNSLPGIQDATQGVWEEALAASEVLNFRSGAPLIQCGDSPTHFAVVLQGVVRVYQAAESGKEICLYRVHEGQVCVLTLAKLMKMDTVCAQAVAEQDVKILAIPVYYYERLLGESSEFRNHVIVSMAECLTDVMQMVANVSFQRLELRLACLIGKLVQSRGSDKLKVTHQEVANELGTTREVVSRILKEFEIMGCVKLRRGTIEVLSGETLQKMSS